MDSGKTDPDFVFSIPFFWKMEEKVRTISNDILELFRNTSPYPW